jgi:hypothetical protein
MLSPTTADCCHSIGDIDDDDEQEHDDDDDEAITLLDEVSNSALTQLWPSCTG